MYNDYNQEKCVNAFEENLSHAGTNAESLLATICPTFYVSSDFSRPMIL